MNKNICYLSLHVSANWIRPSLKSLIKYTEVAGERSLGLENSLPVDITSMRNTVNSWGTKPEISGISLFPHSRNLVQADHEVPFGTLCCYEGGWWDGYPALMSQVWKQTYQMPWAGVPNRGGWDYPARMWSQVRVQFLPARPPPTYSAEYLLTFLQQNLG